LKKVSVFVTNNTTNIIGAIETFDKFKIYSVQYFVHTFKLVINVKIKEIDLIIFKTKKKITFICQNSKAIILLQIYQTQLKLFDHKLK
jgi:hypothetical protein